MERKPIIKMYFSKYREAWFSLSEERKMEIELEARGKFKEVGGKAIIRCASYWSNEGWTWFGIEEYPDIEAVQRFAEFLVELGWPRYVESKTYLGTRQESQ